MIENQYTEVGILIRDNSSRQRSARLTSDKIPRAFKFTHALILEQIGASFLRYGRLNIL